MASWDQLNLHFPHKNLWPRIGSFLPTVFNLTLDCFAVPSDSLFNSVLCMISQLPDLASSEIPLLTWPPGSLTWLLLGFHPWPWLVPQAPSGPRPGHPRPGMTALSLHAEHLAISRQTPLFMRQSPLEQLQSQDFSSLRYAPPSCETRRRNNNNLYWSTYSWKWTQECRSVAKVFLVPVTSYV